MITIRPANRADSADLFEWRNDAATRAASITQDPVPLAAHAAWFDRVLEGDMRTIYIADEADVSLGMCRFDLDADHTGAEVSINLNPAQRGRGLAAPILSEAMSVFLRDNPAVTHLTATIRPTNTASRRLFGGLGFIEETFGAEFGTFRFNRRTGPS